MARLGEPLERRQFGRRTTSMHGVALIPGRPETRCLLRDISRSGARLEFPGAIWVPFRFELVVESHGVRVWCEVRHQFRTVVGVMFVTEKPGEQAIVMAFDTKADRGPNTKAPASLTEPTTEAQAGASLRAKVLHLKGK